jgi:hypothetical protein
MDEAVRALLREAEHAHDAGLWLKAASALVRASDHDEAGRALLWARALGAETAPVDDALAPPTLEHERRAVGSLLGAGACRCFGWTPASDALYAAAGDSMIVKLGVAPGNNRRVKELRRRALALAANLTEDALVLVSLPDDMGSLEPRVHTDVLDLTTGELVESGIKTGWLGNSVVTAYMDGDACVSDSRMASRFSVRSPAQHVDARVDDGAVVTWLGEVVKPPPAEPGAPRTLRMVFTTGDHVLSFPTRRSVERFAELATIERAHMNAHEVRDSFPCVAASPSGRHVAFAGRGLVRLVDLVTGERRDVELAAEHASLDARWAPSGRRLAVLTADRVHIFSFPR